MISQKAKYALRALAALARANDRVPMLIADIAEQQKIPKKFLEQILLDLKHRGLVRSKRGKDGGYLLLKPAHEITFGEILRMIDGPIAPFPACRRPPIANATTVSRRWNAKSATSSPALPRPRARCCSPPASPIH